MDYHEAATALFDLRRYASGAGTAATADLLAHLGDPHEELTCVQVAGSNGKGSTVRMLDAVLREAGLDVGCYTSPHLDSVRERVRVNDRRLSRAALTEFVETVADYVTERAADGAAPTFFETLTALALWEFARQDVDVAVLEVGIGGRYDATSVVDPAAAAVTSVTLEHTETLGDTVEEIARDKAHVAPADRPLVTAADDPALSAVREVAGRVHTVGPEGDTVVEDGGRDGLEWRVAAADEAAGWAVETALPLLGAHQARNAGVAATLARQVADVDPAAVERGLRNAHWPGRFEVMGREPLVVLDGAHNPRGCACVADTLATFDYDDLHLVLGAMTDKDHRGMAAALPAADSVLACAPDTDRAEAAAAVATAVRRETDAAVSTADSVPAALARVRAAAGPDDAVLVTGSLYTVAEAREEWRRPATPLELTSEADARAAAERVAAADSGAVTDRAPTMAVRTRLRPRQVEAVRAAVVAVGGALRRSDVDARGREPVDVLLAGSHAQLREAAGRLAEAPESVGVAGVAADLRRALPDADRSGATAGETGGDDPRYPWADGTAVMGILNVTPDSFHDGGEYNDLEDALARAEAMVEAGADVVDVGGESTRPGADPVPPAEERERVVPVVERLADLDAAVSVDTRKAEVARAALDAGADVLNDVSGLADPEMRLVAADYDVPVVVMHSIDAPVVPDKDVHYDDVVDDVLAALRERVLLAEKAGLDRSQVVVDPGVGFGKTAAESFALLDRLPEFRGLGCPVMVGHSHKSMFGLVDRYPDEGGYATAAATALAAERGADLVRVHDVPENRAAVDVAQATTDP